MRPFFQRCCPFIYLMFIFMLEGCATSTIVLPTEAELKAARNFKKTMAIVGFSDNSSGIKGIGDVAQAKLENIMAGYFNLVERDRIKNVWQERGLAYSDETERLSELGNMLGADYLVIGMVAAEVERPQIKYRESNGRKYSAEIWDETCSESYASIKIMDVDTGMAVYADKKQGKACDVTRKKKFKDAKYFDANKKVRAGTVQAISIAESFEKLRREQYLLVSKAIDSAVRGFAPDLRKRFYQSGEILRIISEQEVVINLGSAYGLRPGDKLIVWEELPAMMDPKTGMRIVPRQKKALLTVTQVTSGLSCVARGSKKAVMLLKEGDEVSTN